MRTEQEIKAAALELAPEEMAQELQGCNTLETVIGRVLIHRATGLTPEVFQALRGLAREARAARDPRNDPTFANAPWNRR